MQMEHIEDIYELSPMQQGLLFHTLHTPELNAYFEQFCWRLEGSLDRDTFRQVWQDLCDRHSILRTAFCWEGLEQPYQVVYRQVDLPWDEQNWQHLSTSEQEKRFQDCLQTDRDRGFVLQQAPLMRCTLIQLEPQVYYFIWSHHHLLLDGWSTALLFKEILADYQARSQQQALALAPSRPYRDYILWLQQQNPDQAEPFWRQYLQGFTTPTTIHLEQSKRVSLESRAEQQIYLSIPITQSLKTFAQQQRLTLNTIVQAAWALVLSGYSGEADVVFGTVVSGRPPVLPGVESMVGLLINTLPLRVSVPSEADLIPWLQQLQVQQMERQEYEYSSLAQIQRWSDVPASLPLFNSLLVFENYPIDASVQSRQTNLTIERVGTHEQTNYPLTLTAIPGERLLLQIAYNPQQFTNDAIDRLLTHLQTVLEQFIRRPHCQLKEISLLTPSEQHQLLIEWNHLENLPESETPFCDRFAAQAERTPNAIALIHNDQQLTYRELNQRANQLAHSLQSLGVGSDVLVGVCLPRSIHLIVSLLAILKAGGAYVPLDPEYPQERLSWMLRDTQVSVLLTLQSFPNIEDLNSQKESLIHCVDLDRDWHTLTQFPDTNPVCVATEESLAYVIYTSGSTGKPKGVMIQRRSLAHFVSSAVQVYSITAGDRVLQFASISFDAAVEEIFPTLCQGATLVLRTDAIIESIPRFVQACRDWSISVLDLPTAFWHQLAQTLSTSNLALPDSVRLVIIGGEKALTASLNLWRQMSSPVRLMNGYGPTEATVVATCCEIFGANAVNIDAEVPIGKPLPNVQVYVLDSNLNPVPIGVPGELYIGGAGVARGYLNRPDLTNQRFIPNPFRSSQQPFPEQAGQPESTLYRTGDRVRYRADGHLEFLGRIDHQVKIRGFRIELGEIEAALVQHPQVQEAIVLASEDHPGQTRLIAYLVTTSGVELPDQTWRDFLKQRLPSYMLPSTFVSLHALPLTPSGKVDRQALPIPPDLPRSAAIAPPRTSTEIQLAQIWTELLNVQAIGIHDHFFELGGHSLLTTQLLSRIQVAFAADLSLRQLFAAPTIAELAALIDRQGQSDREEQLEEPLSTPVFGELAADAVLSPDIQPAAIAPFTPPNQVLLTGATGFLGSFLLAELLRQTSATVYCLVRADDEKSAAQRLQRSLQSYQLWREAWRDRIIPIPGDLAQPDLGLSPDSFQCLAATIDSIYHNGAWVHHALPYASLKAANVLGTEAVLRLACQHRAKPVHFISTTSVFSTPSESGVHSILEQRPLEAAPTNGYAQTKWVAERLLWEAGDRGLPISIYRPGRISGDSQTGVFNANDLLYRLIIGCVQLGSAPEGEMQIDFAPVDYVSQAIVHLSQQPSTLGQAFHLVNPHPWSAAELIDKIRSLGYSLQQLSYGEWRSQLQQIAQHQPDHPLYPLLPLFPPAQETTSSHASLQFDCRNTLSGLAETSIQCPPVADRLLDTYLSYLIKNGHLPLPTSGVIHANSPL